MKKFALFTIVILFLVACNEKEKSKTVVKSAKTENITPKPVTPLTPPLLNKAQLTKIELIHETFKEVYPLTLEETVLNFQRDQHPDKEIEIWLYMAKVFNAFAESNKGVVRLGARKEAFKLILMRSMMSDKDVMEKLDLEFLTKVEAQALLENYTLEATPITFKDY